MAYQASVNIAIPTTGFKRYMFFNRFAVEREETFVQIYFGFVNRANVLLDSYSTTISEADLEGMRQSTMDYLGRQGTLLDPPPVWQPAPAMKMEVANHFVMVHHGTIAETCFYAFSYWAAVVEGGKSVRGSKEQPSGEAGGSTASVVADGLALLRSPLRVQQHLIRLLFASNEANLLAKV